MDIVYGVFIGWMATITGVLVGGLLVFKTKRGGYEPLFTPKSDQPSAFNLADEFEQVEDEPPPIPEVVSRMNEKFQNQFVGGKE